MKTLPNISVINLTISGFIDSREVVNKLNEFYAGTGVVVSQKAKYERPTWFYILAALGRRHMTVNQIVDKLKRHNITIGYHSVLRFLKIMSNTSRAIHPHKRHCGVSCHELVTSFGGVHREECSVYNGRGCAPDTYYLGASVFTINYQRRVHNVFINPR